MPLTKELEKQAKNDIYKSIERLIERYISEGVSIYDLSRYFRIGINFNKLLNDINYIGRRYFQDGEDYPGFVKKILSEVILDIKSELETVSISESKIIKFNDYNVDNLHESIIIPNEDLTVEYLFNDIEHSDQDIDIIASFFDTKKDFIQSIDPQFNVYSVSDFKADVLNNNRISFNVLVLEEHQILKIKNSIVKKIINGIYSEIPEEIDYMGIRVKPHTLMDKGVLKESVEKLVTNQEVLNVVSNLTKYKYVNNYNNYHIWKKES